MQPQSIAIIGADGHVGRHLATCAEEAGLVVRKLGRYDDISAALGGVDAVIHLAGTLQATGGNTYEAANVETVKRTTAAAAEAGVQRVVFLSYVGADPRAKNAYLRTKGEAEELLRASRLDVIVLRSTFIFGPPTDPGPSIIPFVQTDGKPVSVVGSGTQRYQPVYVEDVARALLGALHRDIVAGTYALSGPDVMSVDDLVALVNGGGVKERHLVGLAARAAAAIAPSLTQAMVGVLSADSLPDVPLAWSALGLQPTPMQQVYAGDRFTPAESDTATAIKHAPKARA